MCLLCVSSLPVIAHLVCFAVSIECGFTYVVHYVYHIPQDPAPFYTHPHLIYLHMYGSGVALLIGLVQCIMADSPPSSIRTGAMCVGVTKRNVHIAMGGVYLTTLTVGTLAAVMYAMKQSYGDDGGVAAQISFAAMGLASLLPAWMGFVAYLLGNPRAHRLLMERSILCLFSSFVVFRLLARFLLPLLLSLTSHSSSYGSWVMLLCLSWALPLVIFEAFRAFSPLQADRECKNCRCAKTD
jgi:hypothetical protein